ncbi:NfeD family protein [Algoriphagus sp. C2-7]|uniref:NfeD family protein n=2 Tax=Algoriphagus sediminis TaxID=3057113 RepID=A0ABT7Y882_9BACT|nr:NfeD family protein [Algoriphagus sediminis]MDN3202722.1 NfeD family protein [Algoriphagus sediminis]
MTLLILSTLLLIGLVLMLVEVLFVPGTTFVGIFGLVISIAGLVFAFANFETSTAWTITAIAVIANLAAIVYGFRSGVWNRFSLKTSLKGGAFDGRLEGLYLGMPGKAISDLKPIGKAMFGENIYEVKSKGSFISVGSEIEIIKIENNTILVK